MCNCPIINGRKCPCKGKPFHKKYKHCIRCGHHHRPLSNGYICCKSDICEDRIIKIGEPHYCITNRKRSSMMQQKYNFMCIYCNNIHYHYDCVPFLINNLENAYLIKDLMNIVLSYTNKNMHGFTICISQFIKFVNPVCHYTNLNKNHEDTIFEYLTSNQICDFCNRRHRKSFLCVPLREIKRQERREINKHLERQKKEIEMQRIEREKEELEEAIKESIMVSNIDKIRRKLGLPLYGNSK